MIALMPTTELLLVDTEAARSLGAIDVITMFFLLVSAVFSFIAALGIVRMPDLFTRMQAAAKTGTLGVGCALIALTFHFSDVGVTTRASLVIIFLFLTAPIAAHLIARAGYISGVRLWEHSVCDEMKGQYDQVTHALASGREDEEDLLARRPETDGSDPRVDER